MTDFDFISRMNPEYVEELYRAYREDPASVDERWALVFSGYEFADRARRRGAPPGRRSRREGTGETAAPVIGVFDLVHSYRELGHLIADLDPLGHSPRETPLLRLEEFGFTEEDLDRVVQCGSFRGLDEAPLGELLEALRQTYCGTLGLEYLDIAEKDQRDWIQDQVEPHRNRADLTAEHRRIILRQLIEAETFETFMQTKYIGQKRFSLEGGEALIPLLDTLVEESAGRGVRELVLGMPHRGRLNVLTNILKKPPEMVLAEFEGTFLPSDIPGDGDVKYHLGYSHDSTTRDGHDIHLSLSSNPSHLEAINPVVEGIVRAKQSYRRDDDRETVMPVLLHGDASFAGQGLVYETIALSKLEGYTTGGTVHVIVNNQIGFTTSPSEAWFTRYPSDLARVIQAPVFHVNGDDPEAAVQAARLATAFRQTFHCDVFIDFICYRKHGHNELDDPTFTQPLMYKEIREHPPVTKLYGERLRDEGIVTDDDLERLRKEARSVLEDAHEYAREFKPRQQVFALGGVWQGLEWAGDDWSADTSVDAERLRDMADRLRQSPEGFRPHKRLQKLLDDRHRMVEEGEGIDWGCAETLAYASLLVEGIPVRLTGQDTARGTFSHRHAVLHDGESGDRYVPLNHLSEDQARIEVFNSPLSEAGVLGFEYGMSSADPRRLVVWEAQFGDFCNGAQVIIDQFVASGESKWQRMSGITLLLPHGYEGQGPEHSSARLERFLQLSAEKNWQVVNCTTPAQVFHVLRRQMHRSFRKPLIVMSPKSLLRHPRAVSTLEELSEGRFEFVLDDPTPPDRRDVRRVLLCSGKIFYALEQARTDEEIDDVAIVRVEQLYPFPFAEVRAVVQRYPRATELCWVQEEPANMGAWTAVRQSLADCLEGDQELRMVSREEAASPATGSYELHQLEEKALIDEALKPSSEAETSSSEQGRAGVASRKTERATA